MGKQGMTSRVLLALLLCLSTQHSLAGHECIANDGTPLLFAESFRCGSTPRGPASQEGTLVFPTLLKKEALEAGNPLATYAAMSDLERQYQQSKIFAVI